MFVKINFNFKMSTNVHGIFLETIFIHDKQAVNLGFYDFV